MFSQEVADTICERIAEGEPLRAICREEGMPDKATVFRWLADESRASFRDQYARAREAQADALFDEILIIADDSTHDYAEGRNGETIINNEAIGRSRLRVDARKWMAGKLKPKVYGDKIEQTLQGTDGQPITMIVRKIIDGSK